MSSSTFYAQRSRLLPQVLLLLLVAAGVHNSAATLDPNAVRIVRTTAEECGEYLCQMWFNKVRSSQACARQA